MRQRRNAPSFRKGVAATDAAQFAKDSAQNVGEAAGSARDTATGAFERSLACRATPCDRSAGREPTLATELPVPVTSECSPGLGQVSRMSVEINGVERELFQCQVYLALVDVSDPERRAILRLVLTANQQQFTELMDDFQQFVASVAPDEAIEARHGARAWTGPYPALNSCWIFPPGRATPLPVRASHGCRPGFPGGRTCPSPGATPRVRRITICAVITRSWNVAIPAVRWIVPGAHGSGDVCGSCSRLRAASRGEIRPGRQSSCVNTRLAWVRACQRSC